MPKAIRVETAKFLDGLAAIAKTLKAEYVIETRRIILDDRAETLKSSAAYREGMIVEHNKGNNDDECPLCGGMVYYCDGPAGGAILVCGDCHMHIPDAVYDRNAMRVSERGVADFVGRAVGEFHAAQDMGNGNYRLGAVCGREAYFCVAPQAGFFNSLERDVLVITCDDSNVPQGWTTNGRAVVRFAELFYATQGMGEIRIAKGVLKKIDVKEPVRRFGKNRRIHPRRDKWLSVVMNILASKYRPSDFKDGMLTAAGAKRWFSKLFPTIQVGRKTFGRDIDELCNYDPAKHPYDKRQPHIVRLLKLAADPTVTQDRRLECANMIKQELERASAEANRNGGRMVELPEWGWINGADGGSERVPVASDADIYASVDKALGEGKKVGVHAA